MEQKEIYAIYDEKHKNKIVAFMNTLNLISKLSVQDVVELLNNYEKDCFAYEQLLRKNAITIDSIKKELFTYKLRANNANNTNCEMQATIDKLRRHNKGLKETITSLQNTIDRLNKSIAFRDNELVTTAKTIDRLNKKVQQLEDDNNKNMHTYDHCYKEVSSELYAYKQLLKSLARNAVGIQDICNNAVNCNEISCDGNNITIKNGKQTIDVEVDKNGK